MAPSEHRAVVQGWADALSAGELDRALGYLAPDFVGHYAAMPDAVKGPEGFKGMYQFFIQPAFPDQKITIEREVVADDKIAVQVSWTATHKGPFLNIPATGKTILVPGTGIFRIADGKIAETWMLEDFLGIYQQLDGDLMGLEGIVDTDNLAVMRRYYDEVVNQGNLATVDEVIADDYVSHHNDPAHLPPGPAGVKAFVTMTRQGFPDLKLTVDQVFGAGDQVASMWTMEGTHSGEWFGTPATGKHAKWSGVVITQFADGKIAEDWYNFDQISLLQQLGIIPT